MGQLKRYPEEYELEAVVAHPSGQTFTGVSINLGISDSSLHRWARAFGRQGTAAFPGHGKVSLTSEHSELGRL